MSSRKRLIFLSAFAKAVVVAGAIAQPASTGAGNWPTRPIHLIVPFPAGSSPDLIARILAEKLPQSLGQAVVVENRPGAGGNLGTGLVAKAAPDRVARTSNESTSMNQLDGSILILAV